MTSHFTFGLGLVSQVGANGSSGYYDFNESGSTVGITGVSGGYVDRYAYTPFGDVTTLVAATSNPYTYSGQAGVLDDGTGLFDMRAREFDATTGQFTSPDPANLAGGTPNLRQFAANNDISFSDPSGLCFLSLTPPPDTGLVPVVGSKSTKMENFTPRGWVESLRHRSVAD